MQRFTKTFVHETIEKRIVQLEVEWSFNPTNGTAQLNDSGREDLIAYGEYEGLQRLLERLNLDDPRY